ncbi:MAG: deoxyribonuclease IV [Planctomycetes bacterium]|nr:deoxyribonuclease IV [Planctomycetota bacterium]
MPLLGAHMSIAGGLHKAVEAAAALGMETVQIFTHSPSQWAVKPVTPAAKELHRDGKSLTKNNNQWNAKDLTNDELRAFHDTLKASNLQFPTAHDSYLINLASPDPVLYRKSLEAFVIEVQRADALGLSYLVMHPGTPTDGDDAAGLKRIISAFDEVHQRCHDCRVMILLEATAGQGKSLGWRFEHLATILDGVQESKRLGVCVDTCHVFAAGYPLAPVDEYERTLHEFDSLIGLKRIKVFHMNDSKKPLGSRVDRHEHIGQGHLGLEPFRLLVNDPRFEKVPMIMETPKEGPNDEDMDVINLHTLRGLVGKKRAGRSRVLRGTSIS